MTISSPSPSRPAAGAVLLVAALALAASASGAADELSPERGYALAREAMHPDAEVRGAAAKRLRRSGDETMIPALVDALFFAPAAARETILETLRALADEDPGTGYYDWVELVGRRTDLEPKPGYLGWKGELLAQIDPTFRRILSEDVPIRIRPQEIVWGGVKVNGIPALLDAPAVAPSEAGGLTADEEVFGVSFDGEQRAYPLRYLSWHEMANDVLGGSPITVAFCTLCDSGVAYSALDAERERRIFLTSGLLYRSNKLMVDRGSLTLWSALTGEPVLGPLVDEAGPLDLLPVTRTTWAAWRDAHPDTTVLYLDEAVGERFGFDYRPGAADEAREGVSFPVWLRDERLGPRTEVYGLRAEGTPRAYPVADVLRERVVHDRVGDVELVVLGDPEGGAVRAYRSGGRRFTLQGTGGKQRLLDGSGLAWRIEEDRLVPEPPRGSAARAPSEAGADEGSGRAAVDLLPEPLERVPGHRTLWFAWYGFFPRTGVYEPG